MKRIVLAIVIFAMSISTACADYYKINVTRVSSNIYKIEGTSPTIYILTKYCYVYGYSMNAILKYDKFSFSNKIIFVDQDQTCEVNKLIR